MGLYTCMMCKMCRYNNKRRTRTKYKRWNRCENKNQVQEIGNTKLNGNRNGNVKHKFGQDAMY